MEDLTGHQFDYYRVEEEIGRGGMARVYRAQDTRLGRMCALKVLLPEFAADEQYVNRFVREARSAAQLDHPHIVPIYDVGHTGRQYYISMRYYTGGTLLDLMRRGHLTTDQIVNYLSQAASALDFAHTRNIIHRDVKPSNMIIDERAGLILTDFGIAAQLNDPSVTSTGLLVGTPAYFTPEQIRGQRVSPQTDIYQLGASTYELLAGAQPFSDRPSHAVLAAHLEETPAPIHERNALVDPRASQVIARAMDKDPARRYPTATAYVNELKLALQGKTPAAAVGPSLDTTVIEQPPASPPPIPPADITTTQRDRAGGGSSRGWWIFGCLAGIAGLAVILVAGALVLNAASSDGGLLDELLGNTDDPTATASAAVIDGATPTATEPGSPEIEVTAGEQDTATPPPTDTPTESPPTPTPSATPTPVVIPATPVVGGVVTEDSLLVDWPILEEEWGATFVENNAFHVRLNPGRLRLFFTNADYGTFLSFTIELRMITSTASEACQVVHYATNGEEFHDYYVLCIDNEGNLRAGYLATADTWTTYDIDELGLLPLTVTPSSWNALSMISRENQLWFLVNGVAVAYTDAAFLESGQTGMAIENTGVDVIEWEFTNLVIRDVE